MRYYTIVDLDYKLSVSVSTNQQLVNRPVQQYTTNRPSLSESLYQNNENLYQIPTTVVNSRRTTRRTTYRPITQKPTAAPPSYETECGRPKIFGVQSLVVNGNSFTRGEWPWIAALIFKEQFTCGGTLVSQNHIISAAHCFHDKQAEKINIKLLYFFLGGHNLLKPESVKRKLSAIIIHPDWKTDSNNYDSDIAIAILSASVQYTDYIIPACIYPARKDNSDIVRSFGSLVGWGTTQDGTTSEEDPKSLNIEVVSDAECLRSHQVFSVITSNKTFCAGT